MSGEGAPGDRLALADWRRRIAALYAEVRAMAATDPTIAHGHWRAVRETLYRSHPQSPLGEAVRASFRAAHFPYDPALRVLASVEPAPPSAPHAAALTLPDSGPEQLAFERIGTVRLPFAQGERTLSVFWMAGYAGGLFLPFRDATNGAETYGAGRYLIDAAKGADLGMDERGRLILDFNFAYQPSCAFDPRWACPLAPPENRLDIAVRAGEHLS